jgi:raffinose/stachyose/melibiose transport system permease protein
LRDQAVPGTPRRTAYLFIAPALLAYIVFGFLPFLHTIWLSFFDWDGVTPGEWIGLENYEALWSDDTIRAGFEHVLVLVFFYVIPSVAVALLITVLLTRRFIRGVTTFRAILFLPQTLAAVAIAVSWRFIYGPDGDINRALRAVGLDDVARNWLAEPSWALIAIGFIGAWITYGFCMVLFLAGYQKIPNTLFEASRVDGAGPLREFRAVTLPGLRTEMTVAVVVAGIAALRCFDLVYVTTAGGPGDATVTPTFTIFQRAFVQERVGSAAAIAVVLTVVVAAFTFAIIRLAERRR